MSRRDDERNKLMKRLISSLEEQTGTDILAIFVGYITLDGQGHGITAVGPDVEYEADPGTEQLTVEVAFLTSIRDSINELLADKLSN